MQNAMAAAPADAGNADDMLSEVDSLMAKIGLPVPQAATPDAEAAVDQAAEAVVETIETEPANDDAATKSELIVAVAAANDILVVELEPAPQFDPADLVGEIVITGTSDVVLSEIDTAAIASELLDLTPAPAPAAEAVTETIETEPANDITNGDLLAEVAEANDIMVVELEQPEQFVPTDLVGEIMITGTADDALIPGDIPSFSEIDTSAIAGELLDLTPAPAEVLPAPVEPAPVDSRAELKEAHGIVPANDPVITILVQTFKVLAKDDPNHAMFANTEPNSETVQLIMMSTGLEGSIDEITKKAIVALKIAKDELSAPPPRRGRKAAAAGTTAAAAAGSAASAPRVPKSPSSKVLTYTPFVGHGIATAGIMADLQGRTKLIGLPDQLLWESTAHRGPKNRDQLDHSRPESYAPVMPCLHRLANTGNAFPADVNDPVVQPSAEKYRPLAAISYATFEALKAGPIEVHNDVTLKGIIEGIGQVFTNETRSAVIDTLRSLWTVGLVTRETAGGRKQRYTLVAGATPSV